MKHARSLALLLALLATPLFAEENPAADEVSFDYFREALSPFGEWIDVGDYGLCWRPSGVAADWAPYTDGYWAYTDAGWTWVSYEDWGGITYHYGRWINVVDEGWVWVPDYQWGPAWVSWRSNDDYVGWAPLPPEARWNEGAGFGVWVDTSYDIGPETYRFCHTRDFCAPVLAPLLVPCGENVTFITSTVNITNICFNRRDSSVFCGGPNFERINHRLPRPIPALILVREDRREHDGHRRGSPQTVRGNELAVYAPRVRRPDGERGLSIAPQRTVGADKINRGWSRNTGVAQQEQIKERLHKQTEGLNPHTAPARLVKPADVASIPKVANPNVPTVNVVGRGDARPGRNLNRPQTTPAPVQSASPPVVANPPPVRVQPPNANPPPVAERVRPQPVPAENVTRPAQPPTRPFNNPPAQPRPARPAQQSAESGGQSTAADASRQAEAQRNQQMLQRRQQAEAANQQQENARRAETQRNQQAPQPRQQTEAVNQQKDTARRAAEARSQQASQQAAQQRQQEAAQQAGEARRQQAMQQRQQTEALQQRQADVQRAGEARRQQVDTAQRANEIRSQQVQAAQSAAVARERQTQAAVAAERSREIRQQQQPMQRVQPETPRRQSEALPQVRPVQPTQPAASSPQGNRTHDDGKKKQRGEQ